MILSTIDENNFNAVLQIYEEGMSSGIATYETSLPNWSTWDSAHLKICRLALFEKNIMIAWAALSSVSNRRVYRGVAELSIYVSAKVRAKGVGKHLLLKLIQESEKKGIWTLQSGIFKDNFASIKLHEHCGFRKIGFREKIAQRDGIWYDNVLMERRSKIIGISS